MKISVSSYSFAQYITEGKMTQFDAVAKAKEIGFGAIEFTALIADPNIDSRSQDLEKQIELANKIKQEADRLGIEINAYTIGSDMCMDTDYQDDLEFTRLKGQLEVAKALGAKVMRHDAIHHLNRFRSFDLAIPTLAKNFRQVADYAQTLGIKTCFENHGHICQDYDRCEKLFNAIDHNNFGLLLDMGNFLCADCDPVMAYSRLAPYAIHAHAKDFSYTKYNGKLPEGAFHTRGANYLLGQAVGEGDVPVKQCIKILNMNDYDGYLSIEYEGMEDCIEGITRGFNNLKRFVEEVKNER